MAQAITRYLTCPIIRQAKPEDAEEVAELILNSGSPLIKTVFSGHYEPALQVLTEQYQKYYQGIYVLTEGERIISVMKLHLPGKSVGQTISLRSLIRILGFVRGIKAMLLLSPWDEYKLSQHEAYLEFLYTHLDWHGYDAEKIMIERAYYLSNVAGAKYMTHFIAKENYKQRAFFEDKGFIPRRTTHLLFARITGGSPYWKKYTITLIDGPITVKEFVQDKIVQMRYAWKQRRREVLAATKLALALTIVPITAGYYAFIRGYPLAALGWVVVTLFQMLGATIYLRGSNIGRIIITAGLLPEGVNLMSRVIRTESWFDRAWLLPLAFLNIWICYVVLAYPSNRSSIMLDDERSMYSNNS